ncbi:MAG: translocation protein TolB [Candidatus Saccharibacteria bacterium]|nr:translocation protein TolB [Candidatus Saccharibacteria bacterium]
MKRFSPLHQKGFTHVIALVVIVLIAAIGGTYYLVASHADSATTNGYIVYQKALPNNAPLQTFFTLPTGGKQLSSTTSNFPWLNSNMQYSPDGAKMSYIEQNGTGSSFLYVQKSSGTARVQLPSHYYSPFSLAPWSKDGQWLAVELTTSVHTYPYTLAIMHPDGTAFKTIPNSSDSYADYEHASWSPDGQRLFYARHDGYNQLCSISITGTGKTCKTFTLPCTLDWALVSPDGTSVMLKGSSPVVNNYSSSCLYTAKTDGTGLTVVNKSSAFHIYQAAWSPDGKAIAYGYSMAANGQASTDNGLNVYTLSTKSTSKIVSAVSVGSLTLGWMPVKAGAITANLPTDVLSQLSIPKSAIRQTIPTPTPAPTPAPTTTPKSAIRQTIPTPAP